MNYEADMQTLIHFLQDPEVVTAPLAVEYGPVSEEEERVAMHPDDPTTAARDPNVGLT